MKLPFSFHSGRHVENFQYYVVDDISIIQTILIRIWHETKLIHHEKTIFSVESSSHEIQYQIFQWDLDAQGSLASKMLLTLFLPFFLPVFLPSKSSHCFEKESYKLRRSAHLCFNQKISKLSDVTACEEFNYRNSDCSKMLEKCFSQDFVRNFSDFYISKAMSIKQWNVLSHKILGTEEANSVFYFFSPFIIQFCSSRLSFETRAFVKECKHVRKILKRWPPIKMNFMKCSTIIKLTKNQKNSKLGPAAMCPQQQNLDHNICVQKYMNLLPLKKHSSLKEACNHIFNVRLNVVHYKY